MHVLSSSLTILHTIIVEQIVFLLFLKGKLISDLYKI